MSPCTNYVFYHNYEHGNAISNRLYSIDIETRNAKMQLKVSEVIAWSIR